MPNQYSYPTHEKRVEAFWEKVDRSGGDDACWLWTASTREGYGQMTWGERPVGAHRISWELMHGVIPDGLYVLHNCPDGDNPRCVNPAHLFLGTPQENMDDMKRKGRVVKLRGQQNGKCKLTDAQVAEIRRRYAAGGVSQWKLAAEYGVDQSNISYIVRRKSRV